MCVFRLQVVRPSTRTQTAVFAGSDAARYRQPMRLIVGKGGWCRWSDEGATVYVRFGDVENRLRVTALYWPPAGPITPDRLRGLRLGQVEAFANVPEHAASIRDVIHSPGVDLHRLATYFDSGVPADDHWIALSLRAQLPGSGIEQPPIRNVTSPRPA